MKYCIFDKNKNRFQIIDQNEEDLCEQDEQSSQYDQLQCQVIQEFLTIPSLSWDAVSTPIKLSMTLQQPYTGVSPVDQALLWAIALPTAPASKRPPFVVFRKGQIVVQNWSISMPPTCIYLGADGMQGYMDSNGMFTQRLARYVQTGIIQSGTTLTPIFSVTYELKESIAWPVPLNYSQFNLRVYFDDSSMPVQLPLPFQIGINVEFRKFVSSSSDIVNSQNQTYD